MKKNISYLFILFILACSNKIEGGIDLFNGNVFALATNEKEALLTEEVKLNYNAPEPADNIPLFKCIKGIGYDLFIGIPIETSIDKYYALKKANGIQDSNLIKTDSTYYNYVLIDGTYYVEMLLEKEKSLFFVKAQTAKQNILETVLSKEEITKRFITK